MWPGAGDRYRSPSMSMATPLHSTPRRRAPTQVSQRSASTAGRCGMQHDENQPEDLDSDLEDHQVDQTHYACMARPYQARSCRRSDYEVALACRQRISPARVEGLSQPEFAPIRSVRRIVETPESRTGLSGSLSTEEWLRRYRPEEGEGVEKLR